MKRSALIFILLISTLFACGCSKTEKSLSCEELVIGAIDRIEDFPKYTVMVEMSDPTWEQQYKAMYGVDPDTVDDIYVVHSSEQNENMEAEIAVICYSSNESAESVVNDMNKRKSIRSDEMRSFLGKDENCEYVDKVVNMIDNTIIDQYDKYIVYVCCNNQDVVGKYLEEKLK